MASPNPDYPSEVKTVTGENTINVMGRNLLDESTLRQGTYNGFASPTRCFFDGNKYLEAGTYTIVTDMPIDTYKYAINIGSNKFPGQNDRYDSGWKQTSYFEFTLSSSQTGYLGVVLATSDGSGDITPSNFSSYHFMVYKGSYDSTIPYSPYQSQSYPINLQGKNLFDLANAYHGSISGTGTEGANEAYRTSQFITTQANVNYYFSTTQKTGQTAKQIYIAYYDSSKTFLSRTSYASLSGLFTTPSNCSYMRAGVYTDGQENIMLEKGSTATPYEEFWQIELAKISTYKDKIYNDDNDKKWYLRKEIGKVLLENFTYSRYYAQSDTDRCTTTEIPNIKYVSSNTQLGNGIAEKYLNHTGSGMSGVDAKNHFAIDVSMFQVTILKEDTPSGLFYYALATPTVTEITDENLISQLEAVKLLSGTQNNFTIDADTLPTLNLNYIGEANPHL